MSEECQHEWEQIITALPPNTGIEQHIEGCPKCGAVRYWKVT